MSMTNAGGIDDSGLNPVGEDRPAMSAQHTPEDGIVSLADFRHVMTKLEETAAERDRLKTQLARYAEFNPRTDGEMNEAASLQSELERAKAVTEQVRGVGAEFAQRMWSAEAERDQLRALLKRGLDLVEGLGSRFQRDVWLAEAQEELKPR